MKKVTFSITVLGIMIMLVLLVACGGGEAPTEEVVAATPVPAPTEEAAAVTPVPAPAEESPPEPAEQAVEEAPVEAELPAAEETGGAIDSYQDVEPAVIEIQSQGSFVDPAEGLQLNTAGGGSGFIIDESGIAVTNNHVVTGAAFLEVWVGTESEPRNAQILGVSECSDLAVIDIEGEGFPYLEWYDSETEVGTEIYVAGFPVGDPQFTLTRGIVSKREADGRTSRSAIDHIIEYDATTNPGNSGGPVVDENGKVVAIHFASYPELRQAFGISHDVAEDIVEQMRQGQDVLALGINGSAVNDDDGLSGIWVSSVESGSPADVAGIKGGDIVTMMEGLVLATDGTMSDYCNILRSHQPGDALSVEVLRFDTEELLEGQINGRPLETSFSFAEEIAETSGGDQVEGDAEIYDYVSITDDSGSIVMEVPAEWTDIDGSAWVDDDDGSILGGSLKASSNLVDFQETFAVPGVELIASAGLATAEIGELIDAYDYSDFCTYDGRYDYDDSVYTGAYDLYIDCADSESINVILAAKPEDLSHAVVLEGQAVSDADVDALDQVLRTFNVVGALPDS